MDGDNLGKAAALQFDRSQISLVGGQGRKHARDVILPSRLEVEKARGNSPPDQDQLIRSVTGR